MEKEAREVAYRDKRAELLAGLETHVAALEWLDHNTSFDFDVATDIHPNLIDNTTPEGRGRLKFWQDIYDNLAKNPKYTVVRRYHWALEPGCYGFGAPEKWHIDASWIRIFEGLHQEDLKFVKGRDGASRVTITYPSMLIASTEGDIVDGVIKPSTKLFVAESPSFNLTSRPKEYHQEPEFFFYKDFEAFAAMSPEVTDLGHGNYLPLRTMQGFHNYQNRLFAAAE